MWSVILQIEILTNFNTKFNLVFIIIIIIIIIIITCNSNYNIIVVCQVHNIWLPRWGTVEL